MSDVQPGAAAETENDPPPLPPAAPGPPAPIADDERAGRYDANVQLILRRLADQNRSQPKPRWWWSR